MRNLRAAFSAVLVALALGAGAQAADLPPERRQALDAMLRQDCGSCHGMTMSGGLGPALLPATLAGKDAAALTSIVLDGLPGTAMPPWRPLLGAEDAAWMIRELQRGLKP